MERICRICDSVAAIFFTGLFIFVIRGTSFPLYNHPNLLVGECDLHS
jgi:hypothetical protein